MNDERLIVALDFPEMDKVERLVEALGDSVSYYKVGMELYYSAGRAAVSYLRGRDKKIFLDLKVHDIPNTAANAVRSLARLGVQMLNVHASGGPAMMKAAARAVQEEAARLGAERPKLIAVTVLTSVSREEWELLGRRSAIADQVVRLAELAREAGLDGVVASPREAAMIRAACGGDFLIVTPGIRPQGTEANDQSRIAAPGGALRGGSTHLVVGRPITMAAEPLEAARRILREMRREQ